MDRRKRNENPDFPKWLWKKRVRTAIIKEYIVGTAGLMENSSVTGPLRSAGTMQRRNP